jgi:hypothetical protein
MADVAREQGWMNRSANRFLTTATLHTNEYATTELAVVVA